MGFYWKDGKILWSGGKLATSANCCCCCRCGPCCYSRGCTAVGGSLPTFADTAFPGDATEQAAQAAAVNGLAAGTLTLKNWSTTLSPGSCSFGVLGSVFLYAGIYWRPLLTVGPCGADADWSGSNGAIRYVRYPDLATATDDPYNSALWISTGTYIVLYPYDPTDPVTDESYGENTCCVFTVRSAIKPLRQPGEDAYSIGGGQWTVSGNKCCGCNRAGPGEAADIICVHTSDGSSAECVTGDPETDPTVGLNLCREGQDVNCNEDDDAP